MSPLCTFFFFLFSPASTLGILLSYEQLCWDNSYYCLLVFMIGFHIQYDFLTTVPRTWKGHLPHLISVTVKEHPSLWQQKKDRGKKEGIFFFFCRSLDGTLADQCRRAEVHRRTAKSVRRVQSGRSLCFHSFFCVTLLSRVWISTLLFSVLFWSLSPCVAFNISCFLPCWHHLCLAKLPYKSMFLPALPCWQVTVRAFVSVFL